jgi:hypothetical protein
VSRLNRAGAALVLGLTVTATAAWAQMPAPKAMVHSNFITDCGAQPRPDELCRLPVTFEADDAEKHLAGTDLAYWIDGTTFNVVARAQADEAQLTGTIAEGMTPLSNRRPLWGAAYRVTALNRSIIELGLKGNDKARVVYRGPDAPPAPPMNATLKGKLDRIEIQSAALGRTRTVTVYTPPGPPPAGGWPVVYAGSSAEIDALAAITDALIEHHDIRPLAIVALGDGEDGDYLRRKDPNGYQRRAMFVTREALPLVAKRYKLSAKVSDRLLFGIGPAGDWALDTVVRDPSMGTTVAAFSLPGLVEFPFRNKALRLHLQAGWYEPPYAKGARSTCNLAGASFARCDLDMTDTGHAPLIWQAEWAKVLKAVFPANKR